MFLILCKFKNRIIKIFLVSIFNTQFDDIAEKMNIMKEIIDTIFSGYFFIVALRIQLYIADFYPGVLGNLCYTIQNKSEHQGFVEQIFFENYSFQLHWQCFSIFATTRGLRQCKTNFLSLLSVSRVFLPKLFAVDSYALSIDYAYWKNPIMTRKVGISSRRHCLIELGLNDWLKKNLYLVFVYKNFNKIWITNFINYFF